jgi:hypothetical protein
VFQLIALGLEGKLWHTLRDANGTWQAAINPIDSVSTGGPSRFSGIGCSGDGSGGLNVVGVGSDGQLWHTARRNDGSWFSSFDVVSLHSSGGPGRYSAVGAAGSGGPTQLVAVGSDGRLWHTIRNPDNTWQATMGSIASHSAGGPAGFKRVACSGDSEGGLNVVALGSDDQVWHTARRANGSWFPNFDLVSKDSPGVPQTSIGIGAGNDTNNDMQVVVIGTDGALYHTIRQNSGQWSGPTSQLPTGVGPGSRFSDKFSTITAGSGSAPVFTATLVELPMPVESDTRTLRRTSSWEPNPEMSGADLLPFEIVC